MATLEQAPSGPTWVPVRRGRLAVWHRPRLKVIPRLKEIGCDHVVTLLSQREGAAQLGELIEQAGLGWTWLPLENGDPPEGETQARVLDALPDLVQLLDQGATLLIHCSAGIHRTGMVALALLRSCGYRQDEALELLGRMRPVTGEGVGAERIDWANRVVGEMVSNSE